MTRAVATVVKSCNFQISIKYNFFFLFEISVIFVITFHGAKINFELATLKYISPKFP